jgi:NDP-sugar pyrophosphorylase family protein
VILAGGYGTRLAAVLGDLPKGLAPVRGKPFLDLLLEFLARQDMKRVVLCVGHLRNPLIERYSNWPGIRTSFSVETEPLGTGGAVKHALAVVATERFYVLNGDSFCDIDLASLLRFHLEHNALATLAVARLADRDDVGQVQLDAACRVTSFAEKSFVPAATDIYMNAGTYVLERSAFEGIQETRLSLEHELIPRWVRGGVCYGYVTAADMVDIGTPERYARAQHSL